VHIFHSKTFMPIQWIQTVDLETVVTPSLPRVPDNSPQTQDISFSPSRITSSPLTSHMALRTLRGSWSVQPADSFTGSSLYQLASLAESRPLSRSLEQEFMSNPSFPRAQAIMSGRMTQPLREQDSNWARNLFNAELAETGTPYESPHKPGR